MCHVDTTSSKEVIFPCHDLLIFIKNKIISILVKNEEKYATFTNIGWEEKEKKRRRGKGKMYF